MDHVRPIKRNIVMAFMTRLCRAFFLLSDLVLPATVADRRWMTRMKTTKLQMRMMPMGANKPTINGRRCRKQLWRLEINKIITNR